MEKYKVLNLLYGYILSYSEMVRDKIVQGEGEYSFRCLYMEICYDMQFFFFFIGGGGDQGKGNAEASVLGDEGGIFLEGLSRIKGSTECRNAEVSVLGNVSIFLLSVYMECEIFQNAEVSVFGNESISSLRVYMKCEIFQNAGMKEQILNRTSQNFGMNIYFNYKFYCWFWNLIEEQLKIRGRECRSEGIWG